MQKCLVLLQQNGDTLAESSMRLCVNICLTMAKAGTQVAAVIFGAGQDDLLKSLGKYGIDRVYLVPGSEKDLYSPAVRAARMLELIKEYVPGLVILPDTLQGWEIAPVLAVELNAGYVSGCQEITWQDGVTEALVSVYGGQYQEKYELSGDVNVALMKDVHRGAVEASDTQNAEIIRLPAAGHAETPGLELKETFRLPATELEIGEADIIVGIGRAIETSEDFRMMQDLSAAVGGPIGGTRPAVDAGWIPFEKQIGQTGYIVAPELYIAAGLSGAVQHITGVEKAKIVAINNDPQAPVLKLADLGVTGDFREIVPLLVKKLQEIRKGGQQCAAITLM